MKKFAAFLVFCVLSVPAIFAEISSSGVIGAKAVTLEGTTIEDDDLRASGSIVVSRLQADIQSMDGNWGGTIRFQSGTGFSPYAWAWWKPIEQIKLQLGFMDLFALTEIVGWGYHANDAEGYVTRRGREDDQNPFQGCNRIFYLVPAFARIILHGGLCLGKPLSSR